MTFLSFVLLSKSCGCIRSLISFVTSAVLPSNHLLFSSLIIQSFTYSSYPFVPSIILFFSSLMYLLIQSCVFHLLFLLSTEAYPTIHSFIFVLSNIYYIQLFIPLIIDLFINSLIYSNLPLSFHHSSIFLLPFLPCSHLIFLSFIYLLFH